MNRTRPIGDFARPAARRFDAFAYALAAIAASGFVIRLVFALGRPDPVFLSDSNFYRIQGQFLAAGNGFADPFTFIISQRLVPTAFHPPLYSLYLGGLSWLGLDTISHHRIASCALGVVTIVLIGLIGRQIRSPRVGIIAAAIAAATPNLWVPDGILMSEGMGALMTAASLWLAYRLLVAPNFARAAGLGVAIGLAALVRPETVAFSVLIVVPILLAVSVPNRTRVALFLVALIATVAVVSPWLVRSLTIFDRPVVFSTNSQAVIGVANCPSTYSGPGLGGWSVSCPAENSRAYPIKRPPHADESVIAAESGRQGTRYLMAHKARFLSVVVLARIGSTWSLFHPFHAATAFGNEGKTRTQMILGVVMVWTSMALGAVGVAALYRARRAVLWPLLAPGVVATLVSVTAYGTPRFRVIVEPSIAILAAIGIDALLRHRRRPAHTRVPPDPDTATATATESVGLSS